MQTSSPLALPRFAARVPSLVALWIQAIFAKLFGFSGLMLMLPEAIAGVASVALLFYLVRRNFGDGAALMAALVAKGQVRYVMLQGAGGNGRHHFGDLPGDFPCGGFPSEGFPGGGFRDRPDRLTGGFGGIMGGQANATLMQWVQKSCKIVPSASYGGTTNGGMFAGHLYQCGTQGNLAQTH